MSVFHLWVFAGYSRSCSVGIRGVFAGIRGYSRAICLDAWLSLSMLKTRFRFSFAAYFLCGAHQDTNKEKPEILVDQTLYIILIAENDVVAALAPGACLPGAS